MWKLIISVLTLSWVVGCSLYDDLNQERSVNGRQSAVNDERASIGASIGVDKNNWFYFINIIPNGPVDQNGIIREGDRLIGIIPSSDADLIDVHSLTNDEIRNYIVGKSGTDVTLRILRKHTTFYVTLTRKNRASYIADDSSLKGE